jgi:hypothetical protein
MRSPLSCAAMRAKLQQLVDLPLGEVEALRALPRSLGQAVRAPHGAIRPTRAP